MLKRVSLGGRVRVLISTQARRRDHRPERHGRRDDLRLALRRDAEVRAERVLGARCLSLLHLRDHAHDGRDRLQQRTDVRGALGSVRCVQ